MTRYYIILLVGLFFINLSSYAQSFSLNQLLDSALQNNYSLKSAEKNKLIKQSEIEVLQTNYLPRVSTSASFSYWNFLLPNKQKLLGDALTDMYTDVSFYQPLYDFGQTKAKKSIVEDEILLNNEIIRQMKQTIIWGVSNAYFEVLRTESEIQVHASSLQQLQEHIKYSEQLYNIGKVSSVDILKIKVQISVVENKLQQSKDSLLSNKIRLYQLCNLENTGDITIENISEEWYNQYQDRQFENSIELNKLSSNHPLLKPFDIKSDIEVKQKDLLRLQNRPELFSYGVGSWAHGYIPFGDNFNFNIGVGIRYTLPYWGNSSYKHRIKQSEFVVAQYNDQKQQAFLEVKKEIDLCLNTLDEIQKKISSNLRIIELANETIDNATVKYQAGQGNIIDILDAQQILTEAQIAYQKSMNEFLQTLAKLNYLNGNDNYPF
ncbi:MAG: TolC family protein [Candidatus Kapaibacterium sp.]